MFGPILVNASDMVNWARYLEEVPEVTNASIADGLNKYGELVARRTAEAIAAKADLQPSEVYNSIVIQKATSRRLTWQMDASEIAPPSGDWSRPALDSPRDTNQFDAQELVNIVTLEDRFSCEVCAEAAAAGPYSMAQINVMADKWKNFPGAAGPAPGFRTNLIHPNCRCVLTPYANKRRLQVQWGEGAAPELYTARQLGDAVVGELKIAIRAIRKTK